MAAKEKALNEAMQILESQQIGKQHRREEEAKQEKKQEENGKKKKAKRKKETKGML